MLRLPKRIRCKICKEMFENPIHRGSSIVIVTCDGCRRAMFSPATLKKMEQKGAQKSDQDILEERFAARKKPKNTLSTY